MTVRSVRPLLLIAVLCGCGRTGGRAAVDSAAVGIASRTLNDEPSAVIDSTQGKILGVALGMSADSVKRILGVPVREGTDVVDSVPVTVLEFPMGTIRVRAGVGVVDFLCGGDGCLSQDSVGIGDTMSVILQSYGPTPPRGAPDDPEALDYRLGQSLCNLTFALQMGRVTSLELGCVVR